jgi:hypothetical protein
MQSLHLFVLFSLLIGASRADYPVVLPIQILVACDNIAFPKARSVAAANFSAKALEQSYNKLARAGGGRLKRIVMSKQGFLRQSAAAYYTGYWVRAHHFCF